LIAMQIQPLTSRAPIWRRRQN